MQLVRSIPSNWKSNMEQSNSNNTFAIADQHFNQSSRVLTIRKISKEFYWFLTVTIENKPTSQNYFEKKIH